MDKIIFYLIVSVIISALGYFAYISLISPV